MKQFQITLLVLLLSILAGCGTGQNTTQDGKADDPSETSTEDCCLCGDGMEKLLPSHWGQNNVALISLNTFEIRPIEINRYNNGQQVGEYTGVVSFCGGASVDGGFSASLMLDYDRGYAIGSVDFLNDEMLDTGKAASFLCADCLNKILQQEISRCFGVGVVNLNTKEIRLFEESLGGFGLGDFYIDCDLKSNQNNGSPQMDLLIFFCPIQCGKEP